MSTEIEEIKKSIRALEKRVAGLEVNMRRLDLRTSKDKANHQSALHHELHKINTSIQMLSRSIQ